MTTSEQARCTVCGQDVRLVRAIDGHTGAERRVLTVHAEPGKTIERKRGALVNVCKGSYELD